MQSDEETPESDESQSATGRRMAEVSEKPQINVTKAPEAAAPPKRKVKLRPAFLDVMIPPAWFQAAEALTTIAHTYNISDDTMRLYIQVASQMQGYPMVPAVEAMARGDITLEVTEAEEAAAPASKSNLILPPKKRIITNA